LKRDSAIVQSQSKKIKEFSSILKSNNSHLDQSVRLNRDNFVTANLAVEFLREKSDVLLATSKKYASCIDKLQAELEWTMKKVDIEHRSKLKTKKTLNRMLRLLKHRGFDPNADQSCMAQHSVVPIDLEKLSAQEFNVTLHSSDIDVISLCSDITNDSISSPNDDMGQDMNYHHFEATLPISMDEINRAAHCSSKSTTASSENSFATYDNQNIKRQLSMDSTSLAGNSFASYNVPDVSRKVVTLQNNTEHTHASNNSGSHGAAVPPRRLPSTDSCFLAIDEEVSISEESLDSYSI
jgi:acetolactate synthase regulatory subunit